MIKKPHGHLAVRIFCALQRRGRCATLRKNKGGANMEVILEEDIARQLRKVGLEQQRPQSLR